MTEARTQAPGDAARGEPGAPASALLRLVEVRPSEVRVTLMAGAYFFFLLASYFILRPIRDEISVAEGVGKLPWLFTGTLVATLAINPLFSALVARLPVRRFIPIAYRFFVANLVLFYLALRVWGTGSERWLGPLFFVWTSVFNLFVVSVFWGFMADVFTTEQGKRLFGIIGVGGTLGGITGSALTAMLVERIGTVNLLLVSALLLEAATRVAATLSGVGSRAARAPAPRAGDATGGERHPPYTTRPGAGDSRLPGSDGVIGGSASAGITHVLRSPYLLAICLYLLLFTVGSTFLYFQQTAIVGREFADRARRTAFLATMDFSVQLLTILAQLFVVGRLLERLGVGVTLALVPALSVAGFLALGLGGSAGLSALAVFAVFHVLRRAGEYAIAKPAREVLFTVVPREDKYKAKSFIDTFVYRTGDQIAAWSNAALGAVGLAVSTIALVAVPLSAIWLGVGVWLGRREARIAEGASR